MATSILTPGLEPAVSSEIVVGESEQVIIAVYTDDGRNVGGGPVLTLERADLNGNFMTVSTPGYGRAILGRDSQQMIIASPGTYRVVRPDITPWGILVGIQAGT